MAESIHIRNPDIVRLVKEEFAKTPDSRSMTEVAESLIVEGIRFRDARTVAAQDAQRRAAQPAAT